MVKEIYSNKQLPIENCGTGRVYIRCNETEISSTEMIRKSEDEFVRVPVTMYQYDEEIVEVKSFSESNVLSALKDKVIGYITKYDNGDNVNAFFVSGQKVWLDKDTRAGLMLRFNAEKSSGKIETTLWLGTQSITLGIDKAIQMLYAIEVYASACFDNTAKHKANVMALDSIEEVMSYDYTTGYPEKLSFEIK